MCELNLKLTLCLWVLKLGENKIKGRKFREYITSLLFVNFLNKEKKERKGKDINYKQFFFPKILSQTWKDLRENLLNI